MWTDFIEETLQFYDNLILSGTKISNRLELSTK